MNTSSASTTVAAVAEAIRIRQRFVIASHVRPDGDAIGSQLAMAFALRQMGKDVRAISRDEPPEPFMAFPGVAEIAVADRVDDPGDAVIVMESGNLERTGLSGLERGFVINIDHHPGNAMYGSLNWIDQSAAACGEMVFALVRELGAPLTREVATHVYIAILTDTGSFHYSSISPLTFDICRQCMQAGVDPPIVAQALFDSNSLAHLQLRTAVLNAMELDQTGRLAILSIDHALAHAHKGTYEDTEGLANIPLTVRDIVAVIFFKENGPDDWRISMRSKGAIDVNAVATHFGGGGHKNASGCGAVGDLDDLKGIFRRMVAEQIDIADRGSA